MRQPHRNLFYSYRGPTPDGGERNYIFERQLEDNATKALISVLEHSDRSRILMPFLCEIAKLRSKYDSSGVQFALQRVDIGRPAVREKIALVIAPESELNHHDRSIKKSGRPDAWIWEEEDFAVLVETKVVGAASTSQIYRHIDTARGWSRKSASVHCVTWEQVYRFFKAIGCSGNKLDPVSKLLVSEFLEYMNMISVSNQTAFEFEDFAFFALKEEDRSSMHKRAVTSKLRRFVEQLSQTDELKEIVSLYGKHSGVIGKSFSPGKFRDDSSNFWVTVGPKERREHCHLTIRITEQGIRLDAFAPHKNFTKRWIRALRADPAGFLKSLSKIPNEESFCVRLREAYYSYPSSSYKGQRIGGFSDYLEVHPSFLNESNIALVLLDPVANRLKMNHLRPEVFVVRDFSLSEIIGRPDAVKRVATAAAKITPYLRWALKATE